MKKNKYNFENGFIIISSLNKSNELEKYIDKLFMKKEYENKVKDKIIKETIYVYTAKKHEYIYKYTCQSCGNLGNKFFKTFDSFYGTISSIIVCPYCLRIETGFKTKKNMNKLFMKALKYNGKVKIKLLREYKKFIKENKRRLKLY